MEGTCTNISEFLSGGSVNDFVECSPQKTFRFFVDISSILTQIFADFSGPTAVICLVKTSGFEKCSTQCGDLKSLFQAWKRDSIRYLLVPDRWLEVTFLSTFSDEPTGRSVRIGLEVPPLSKLFTKLGSHLWKGMFFFDLTMDLTMFDIPILGVVLYVPDMSWLVWLVDFL